MVLGIYFEEAARRNRVSGVSHPVDTQYSYLSPIKLTDLQSLDPFFVSLIETPAFQRLQDIRFLGGIDYLLVPNPNGVEANSRYTRYQHSIGVAWLSLLYADLRQLSHHSRRLIYAAALLHDVGHGPLSHSLEPIFEQEFGIGHHRATEDIILGRVELGRELCGFLRDGGIDPSEVIAVIDGQHDPFEGFFSGPINFDTIEGILRSRRYATKSTIPISPRGVVRAATLRSDDADAAVVDAFWGYKDEVYKFLIRAPAGVFADYICQQTALRNLGRLTREDFFATESSLFRKLPTLRKLLLSPSEFEEPGREITIRYKVREFRVDHEGDFYLRNDSARYRQFKSDSVLTFLSNERSIAPSIEGTLFDGDANLRASEDIL